ncbi:conserved protein of unknown function [Modestobacter italicus]|uniref:J domain-containing protein n=1 Tax=Modestobacter italicus (strain DSM 44449 / CECT 9708 / BC 501) TaxID=2732864 RepID=I4F0V0_MODI5|nr:hypothetical protein [Modestobacter marinus]CCH89263.1 conserved protein of unknown function [Modestobacter marinus]
MSPAPGPEERRRRRRLLKAHHPDLGGDPDQFIQALTSFEEGGRRPAAASTPLGEEVRFARRPRGLARVTAWYRRRRRPPRVQ